MRVMWEAVVDEYSSVFKISNELTSLCDCIMMCLGKSTKLTSIWFCWWMMKDLRVDLCWICLKWREDMRVVSNEGSRRV